MHFTEPGRNIYRPRPFAVPVLDEVLSSLCTAALQAERERVELLHMLHEFLKNGCSDGAAWHCDAKVVGDGRAYGREGVAIFEPAMELH